MTGQGTGERPSQRGAITPTEHFAECRDLCKALALRPQPLSQDELAAFRSSIARQRALDEARRNPPAEPDLLDVAA